MSRRALLSAGTATLGTIACSAVFAAADIPPYVEAAVADANRPKASIEQDSTRHPAEIMAFTMAKPGDNVVEIWPDVYITRLLSKIVGPTGKIYVLNAPSWPDRLKGAVNEITDNPVYSNVTVIEQPLEQMRPPEPVDVVWTSENYHDFQNNGPFKADTVAMDKAIFAALKPGGYFVVTDYVSAPGAGKTVTQSLHRIDPDVIKQESTAAGFTVDAESDVLMKPTDTLTSRLRAGPESLRRGYTSQIMLRFRKPG